MAKLPEFESLDSKGLYFDYTDYNIINTKAEFDHWFDRFNSHNKQGPREDYIYRGMKEAKHKLFTSSQRQWITNDMEEWYPKAYLRYVQDLVEKSKRKPLIKKVFDVYDYTPLERDVPVLSILQHYGAPTPLMDWTYNINVALFFATENIASGNGNGDIESYFSIYFVNKTRHKETFHHLSKLTGKKHPSIGGIIEAVENDPDDKSAYYITDFEATRKSPERRFKVNSRKPLTSIFNQNIIAQEGLFVFNPHPYAPIEDILKPQTGNRYRDFWSRPFTCFNIKKDLADYVRRRIKNKSDYSGDAMDIDRGFIYPQLNQVVPIIHDTLLNENID